MNRRLRYEVLRRDGYLAALQDAGFEDAARSAVPGIDSQGGGAFGRERESAPLAAPHKAEAHDA